jgi:hypothetical protein
MTYDPQRSHRRPQLADEQEPAPVDALLAPATEEPTLEEPTLDPAEIAPRPIPDVMVAERRVGSARAALLVVLVSVAVAVAVAVMRRRRGAGS